MFSQKRSLAKIAKLRSKQQIAGMSSSDVATAQTGDISAAPPPALSRSDALECSGSGGGGLKAAPPSLHASSPAGDISGATVDDAQSTDERLTVPGEDAMRKHSSFTSAPDLVVSDESDDGLAANGQRDAGKRRAMPSRNHSLKYSGGALHGSQSPRDFDHNFAGVAAADEDDKNLLTAQQQHNRSFRRSIPENELRRRVLEQQAASSGNSSQNPVSTSYDDHLLFPDDGRTGHAPRRTQSLRVTPSERQRRRRQRPDEEEEGMFRASLSPTGSGSSRVGSPHRGHVAVALAQSALDLATSGSGYNSSNSSDEDGDEMNFLAGKNNNNNHLMAGFDGREAVIKSRSMVSLSSNSDPLNQSFSAITADQARTRSFLHGAIGATSLLGPQELERCFGPDRSLRLFVGSWNMNGHRPPRHLADFLLPKHLDFVPDILVVGTQESFPERAEWEARLQETLGPSHVLFHSTAMGTLHLAIFLRRDLVWYCSLPESDSINVRPGSQFKTKGAVATAFLLFGTSFLFVNAHLTAHQDNVRDRIKDYKKICLSLNLPKDLPARSAKHKDISEKFDVVFWCGDLNFRLEQDRKVILREVHGGGDGTSVLDFDQLNFLRREGLIFKGFGEADIAFKPTYKYDVGTTTYDSSSKQRTPSYTDRILFKTHKTPLTSICYDSVQEVTTSDHKPVWGIWELRLRPGRDTIPLAGGLFNRDIYLEGLKRRAEALQPVLAGRNGQSYMCSIQ